MIGFLIGIIIGLVYGITVFYFNPGVTFKEFIKGWTIFFLTFVVIFTLIRLII